MKVLNEFGNSNIQESEIKDLIVQDLVAKIGWIKGNYPNKSDSETNIDILIRHLSFESNIKGEETIWKDTNEIFTKIVKLFPISIYFFGKEFPKIKWITSNNIIAYTFV